jgi:hypothetical protein
MIPQTAAPPPGTGGVQREIYCSSGFANSTLPFLRQCLTFRLPCRVGLLTVCRVRHITSPSWRPAHAGTLSLRSPDGRTHGGETR